MVQATEEIEQRVELRERKLPESLESLDRLAWNYWWSWTGGGTSVFRDLDPSVWEECEHNPRRLLTEVSEFRLTQMATDPVYVERVRQLAERFDRYMADGRTWESHSEKKITHENPVAYFCAEYGIHNSLPFYSGGLGILAGDHLKSASDLGLPLIAVGLLYRSGYFRQSLTADGWQHESYPSLDPQGLPLRLLTDHDGDPVLVELALPDANQLRARVWIAQVGRIPLLLLDSDIPENEHELRSVTDRLYGGDQEHRIKQEILAGIG